MHTAMAAFRSMARISATVRSFCSTLGSSRICARMARIMRARCTHGTCHAVGAGGKHHRSGPAPWHEGFRQLPGQARFLVRMSLATHRRGELPAIGRSLCAHHPEPGLAPRPRTRRACPRPDESGLGFSRPVLQGLKPTSLFGARPDVLPAS